MNGELFKDVITVPLHYVSLDNIDDGQYNISFAFALSSKYYCLNLNNIWFINGWITNEEYIQYKTNDWNILHDALDMEFDFHFDKESNERSQCTALFNDETKLSALNEIIRIETERLQEEEKMYPTPIDYDELAEQSKSCSYFLHIPKRVVESWNKTKHIDFMYPILNGDELNFITISESLNRELNTERNVFREMAKEISKGIEEDGRISRNTNSLCKA